MRNHPEIWRDILWAYEHRYEDSVIPPSRSALWWYRLAYRYPDEFEEFVAAWGRI